MSTTSEPLLSDSVVLTALGAVAGIYFGGPIGAGLLGVIGLFVGLRLDELRALEAEVHEQESDARET